jgi:hypothetical protein
MVRLEGPQTAPSARRGNSPCVSPLDRRGNSRFPEPLPRVRLLYFQIGTAPFSLLLAANYVCSIFNEKMVRLEGLEPPTYWSVASRSIQLSHRRICSSSSLFRRPRKRRLSYLKPQFYRKYKCLLTGLIQSRNPAKRRIPTVQKQGK